MSATILSFRPTVEAPIVFGRGTVMRLIDRASELTRIPVAELLGARRHTDIVWTRWAIMAVAREAGTSLASIGRALRGMDHTSVIHGIRRAAEVAKQDPDFAKLLELLRAEVAQ